MKSISMISILPLLILLTSAVQPALAQGLLYEEYFTGGTPDLTWESAFFDSLGNPLTPMGVDSVTGNPSGDGWVGVVEADTALLGGIGLAIAGDSALTDYTMEAQVYVDVDGDDSFYEGIMMRVNQDTISEAFQGYQLVANFYSPFGLQRLKFRKYSTNPSGIEDLRVYDSDEIPGGVPSESGWHSMKIEAIGNQFWLYWDDMELPDNPQIDTTQTPFSSGEFGTYIFNLGWSQIMCDDIIVTQSTMKLTGPDPGMTGMDNTFYASGATPGERVYFIYGFVTGSTNVPGCPGVTADILAPRIIGFDEADQDGNASITAFVPGGASGRRLYFQAVEVANCLVSNLISYTFP
jgi:hypothetical protein